MKMKKLLAIALSFLLLFSVGVAFSACEILEKRDNILKQLREIPCSGEYAFVAEYGYSTQTDKVAFHTLVKAQMKKDGVNTDDADDAGVFCHIYYDGYVLFVTKYDKKYTVGYIRLEDCSTRIFYTGIEVNALSAIREYGANENYFIYGNSNKGIYCVLDRRTDTLIENVSDVTPYVGVAHQTRVYVENGVEYQISRYDKSQLVTIADGKEELVVEFTPDYILQRSPEMQEVEKILEQNKPANSDSTYELMICDNELFVILESQSTLMGRGVVYPLVFKYTVETDSFEYIGCSAYYDLIAIVKAV